MLRIMREFKALKLHTDSMHKKFSKNANAQEACGTYDLRGFCTAVAILI